MNKKIIILVFTCLFLIINQISAQEEFKNKFGITATIQNEQFGFLLPISITNKISVAPAFNFYYAENIERNYAIGFIPKFYLKKDKVSPFVNLKVGAMFYETIVNTTTTQKNTIDLIWGIGFGGEYFIDNNFSFGIELQGNFTKSDLNSNRFDNPDKITFNTATMVSTSIYF